MISTAPPDESTAEVAFSGPTPQRVDPYGWKIYMRVKWIYGSAEAHLYLDAKANLPFYYLLFYYSSW